MQHVSGDQKCFESQGGKAVAEEMNIFGMYYDRLKNFSALAGASAFSVKPFPTSEVFHRASKGFDAGVGIYRAWLDGLNDLFEESFALCRKAADSEKADSEYLLKASSEMCGNLTDQMVNAVKDTPLQGLEPFLRSVKDSMVFQHSGYMMKTLLQPCIDMGVSMADMLKPPYRLSSDMN